MQCVLLHRDIFLYGRIIRCYFVIRVGPRDPVDAASALKRPRRLMDHTSECLRRLMDRTRMSR